MEIQAITGNYKDAEVQALAVAVFKDEPANEGFLQELDHATGGIIRSVIETEELKGKEGDVTYIHLGETSQTKAKRLLLVGVGERDGYALAQISQMAGTAIRSLRARNVKTIGLIPRLPNELTERGIAAAVEGAIIGLYEMDKYRTVEKEERHIERLMVIADQESNEQAAQSGARRGQITGESINFTRDLANEPGAFMTPTILADRARQIGEDFGLEVDVLDQARMEQEGMGALLSVARGSEEPAKLIVLKYTPEGKAAAGGELLALVGKGVTFDTGGISIKPGEGMELMKYDMTGGATVLGAMRAIAQLKPSIPVLGVIPATENMPSGKATKPGDIVRAMSGKTIEVINTDAEGRLILADAITYAKKLGATRVIDMATLTGAVTIALGDVNAAVLGTDQELIND
jgi:leucyl aminopeptidase